MIAGDDRFPRAYACDVNPHGFYFIAPGGLEGPVRATIEYAAIDAWKHRELELSSALCSGSLCFGTCPIFLDRFGKWPSSAMVRARMLVKTSGKTRGRRDGNQA
jgi:hypothetical protein